MVSDLDFVFLFVFLAFEIISCVCTYRLSLFLWGEHIIIQRI